MQAYFALVQSSPSILYPPCPLPWLRLWVAGLPNVYAVIDSTLKVEKQLLLWQRLYLKIEFIYGKHCISDIPKILPDAFLLRGRSQHVQYSS